MIASAGRPDVRPVQMCPVLVSECGRTLPLDIARFHADPDASELRFLDRLDGPILDVGCGPGRAAEQLRRRGVAALGLDANADLVRLARDRGAHCVHQDVFDPVPFEGRWAQVLLLDGNIGIGGDPAKLLERLRHIVTVGGRALIEVARSGGLRQLIVREHVGGVIGQRFAWATISAPALDDILDGSGWQAVRVHGVGDRLISELERVV